MKSALKSLRFDTDNRILLTMLVVLTMMVSLFAASLTPVAAAETIKSARENPGLTVLKASAAGTSRKVELGLDKSLVVELPRDVRDVLVANPEVADAIVRTARKIFLIGNRVGQTNVFMFDEAGNTVLSIDLKVERDIGPLEELIEKYVPGSNVTVEIANDNVVLTGTVPNPLAASRAADLARAFVTGGEATTGQFTQSSTTSGVAGGIGSTVISNPDQERAVSQIINLLQIEGEDQVHLKVTVAEIRRSILKQLGIDFNSSQIGQTSATILREAAFGAVGFPQAGGVLSTVSRTTGQGDTYSGTIRALERANVLRTLAEPTLTAQSGREASFLAGGEIPVPTEVTTDPDTGGVTVTVERRQLGVSLSFTPIVQSAERISLTVNTEVSDIDTNNGLSFAGPTIIPAISVRRASSTLELPSGGTMVLAGLLRDSVRQTSAGVPYLKGLPILGSLFGSNDFIRNETELVIFVTPYLVRPTARQNLERPDQNYAQANDGGSFFLNKLNRVYGGKKTAAPGNYHGKVGFIYK
ncbi:MAG: type II and III secretion system protein family protein [Rhizobiales bacterium]|nr:type II and III secretion system protein family protein [Hyphomicrobiales bacterium]